MIELFSILNFKYLFLSEIGSVCSVQKSSTETLNSCKVIFLQFIISCAQDNSLFPQDNN